MPSFPVRAAAATLLFVTLGCSRAGPGAGTPADRPPAAAEDPDRPTAQVARTGRVALAAFALAGRVAWRGLGTCVGAASGLVEDGVDGARAGWNRGADKTRRVARKEAEGVRQAARIPGNGAARQSYGTAREEASRR
jgi:hypothetical protein